MKSMLLVLFTVSAFSLTALAQQQEPSPEMQAMSGKIMREVSENLQCQTTNIKLVKENETLKTRIHELETKNQTPK